MNSSRRLRSETVSMTLDIGQGAHHLDVSLVYGVDDHLRELVFVGRGRIGSGLDLLLTDMGVKLSRIIQGRNPDTGEAA